MTVRNLKAILEQAPPDAQVMIHASAPTQDIRVRSAWRADDSICWLIANAESEKYARKEKRATFGKSLKNARHLAGMTCEELREKIGVGCGTVQKWEQGAYYPSLKNLCALQEVLPALTPGQRKAATGSLIPMTANEKTLNHYTEKEG